MEIVLGIVEISLQQGLVYSLVVLGVVISFRLLDFPDLTVDGTFALGGAVVGVCITAGWSPGLAVLVAVFAGMIAGTATGILHTHLRINKILSGILTMSILYTVNLRVMGKPNLSLLNVRTVLTSFEESHLPASLAVILVFLLVAFAAKIVLDLFLHTELGVVLRATGDNEGMVRATGIDTRKIILLGMGLSNGLVALSGSLLAQSQGFADVGMGIGIIIIGLASLLLGESLFHRPDRVLILTLAAIVGSILYQLIISVGLRMGLAPTDLKLATGLMVIGALALRFGRRD